MDRKVLTIVLGLALLVGFFLPYLNFMGRTASGLDIVKNAGDAADPVIGYIWLVFPISGLMLLIGALTGNYPGGRSLWFWLSFLAILFILIIYPLTKGMEFGEVFESFGRGMGVGLWITIVASLVGILYNPRR